MLKDPKKVKELESKMQERLKEGTELLEKAKKERGTEDEKPEASDDDKKEPAKEEGDNKGEEDEMPDIPILSLN